MKAKDISQIVIGLLVMVSFMVVLYAVFKIEMPPTNRELALILLGVLASKFGDVVAYHFNSSKGSAEKTDIISKLPPVTVLLLPLLLLGLLSCGTPKKVVTEVPVEYRERIVERMVPVQLPSDSTIFSALLECDSLNQVVVRELTDLKSRGESTTEFSSGKLTYKLIIRRDTAWMKSDSVIIYQEKPIRVPVEVEINRLTKWQAFQIVALRVLLIIAAAYIIWKYLNPISRVFKFLKKPKL